MLPEGKHSKEVYLGENGIINKVDVKDIMGEVDDPGSVSYDPTIEKQKTI